MNRTFFIDTEVSFLYNHAMIRKTFILFLLVSFIFLQPPVFAEKEQPKQKQPKKETCVSCHSKVSPGIVKQWQESKHGKMDLNCAVCHSANEGEVDAFKHYDEWISAIPTPNDCAACHEKEVKEFSKSHHAKAAQFIGSLDNLLGEVVEGGPSANLGCRQCHGSEVKVLKDGKLDHATWPNTGIGRVNPDGSKGSCSACHYRHTFSVAQARQPENCGKCHMGPDHPQAEIYNESKHGVLFRAFIKDMNLENDADKWIAGKDYLSPTCASCHMSATPTQPVTHDVGDRISWTLRPVISTKLEDWQKRRESMKDVCRQCHGPAQVENFYQQYDEAVTLYNEKFAKPAKAIMDKLYESGKLTKTPFDEKLEWIYYELWHHEGRRARMGASMQGPDFVQWHGFYEVAKHFYFEFLPEVKEKDPKLVDEVLNKDEHRWIKGLSREDIKKNLEFYKGRYKQ